MGAGLVRRDGRERETVTCAGWRENQHQTYVQECDGELLSHTLRLNFCHLLKTAGGYFCCPTQTVRDTTV